MDSSVCEAALPFAIPSSETWKAALGLAAPVRKPGLRPRRAGSRVNRIGCRGCAVEAAGPGRTGRRIKKAPGPKPGGLFMDVLPTSVSTNQGLTGNRGLIGLMVVVVEAKYTAVTTLLLSRTTTALLPATSPAVAAATVLLLQS